MLIMANEQSRIEVPSNVWVQQSRTSQEDEAEGGVGSVRWPRSNNQTLGQVPPCYDRDLFTLNWMGFHVGRPSNEVTPTTSRKNFSNDFEMKNQMRS